MSHWNYRIVKYKDGSGYGLHEVYYNSDGEVCGMTENRATFHSDLELRTEDLIKGLELALKDAKTKPVLDEPETYAKFDGDVRVTDLAQRRPEPSNDDDALLEDCGPIANTDALNDRD